MPTLMWGERGLVTTLFMDLASSETADVPLDLWPRFFEQIFGRTGIDCDWGKIKSVWLMVEPCFGPRGFGSPDAIACIEFKDAARVAVFFEAKIATYEGSAISPRCRAKKGYNSTLNGQLELKHRLAVALASFDGQRLLKDGAWVGTTTYRQAGFPRFVVDRGVLQTIVPKLQRLPAERYLHVAITSDDTNPFNNKRLQGLWPEIFCEDANGKATANIWEQHRDRFGWTNWQACKAILEVLGENSLFLPTYNANKHYIDAARSEGAGPAAPTAQLADWPADRPRRGVSIIYVPLLSPDCETTAVHFSWHDNTCAVRNYLVNTVDNNPDGPLYRATHDVLPLIINEHRLGLNRPPVGDHEAWEALIRHVNADWRL